MAVKRPVFVVTLALILGELLAFLGTYIIILFMCVPVFLVQKIIMKKCDAFFMVIFLFCIIGFCVTKEEIEISNYAYKLKECQVTAYGTYKRCDGTDYGYKYELENVVMEGVAYRKIVVYTSKMPNLKTGNKLKVTGQLKQFDRAANYGNFDVRNYYRSLGIYVSLEETKIQVVDDNYYIFRYKMQRLRTRLKNILQRLCNDENTGLYTICDGEKEGIFSAVLLGDKSDLDEGIQSLYQINGIAHVLAISGLHISTIGVAIYKLLRRRFKFVLSGSLALIVVLGFVFMSGEGISAVRAAGMFAFYLFSQMVGRKYDMLSAMSFVTILVCLTNPFIIYNIAFQMSFGAILGILFINPIINDFLCLSSLKLITGKEIRKKKYIKERVKLVVRNGIISCAKSMVLSLSVNLVLLPILAGSFFQISIYSILLNVMVIPFMAVVLGSVIMAVGIEGVALMGGIGLEGAVARGILIVSKTIVFSGCGILEWYEILCKLFSKIPGNVFVTGKPDAWQTILYYLVLTVVLAIIRAGEERNKRLKKCYDESLPDEGRMIQVMTGSMQIKKVFRISIKAVCIFVLAGVLIFIISCHNNKNLEVLFNDVGQGDCIVIKKENCVVMVDGGSTDVIDLKENRLEPLLKSRGITEIDMAVVTHADTDHISGVLSILEDREADSIEIEKLVLPYAIIRDKNYKSLVNAAQKANTQVTFIKRGDVISEKGLDITCVHPAYEYKALERNGYSTVLDIKYGNFSMLLTGDISGNEEELLIECLDRKYTVLKVAHHGSVYSTSDMFLQRTMPEISVISCGENNSYGHPHEEVMQRLNDIDSRILRTDVQGQIVVETDGNVMEIYHMK